MDREKSNVFPDFKHSIHIFDESDNRLMNIDKNGVTSFNNKLKIAICKEEIGLLGWNEEKVVYASDGLRDLLFDKKTEP